MLDNYWVTDTSTGERVWDISALIAEKEILPNLFLCGLTLIEKRHNVIIKGIPILQ